MKNLLWICIAGFFIAEIGCSDKVCTQVTTFDAICKQDGMLYILSANPCISKYSISVTVINMKNATLYTHQKIDRDTAIPIKGSGGKGAVVIMDFQPFSDDGKDYRKKKLHVGLSLVDIKKYKEDKKRGEVILEAKFPMFTQKCVLKLKRNDHINHDSCHHAQPLGEFSSLCIVLEKSSVNNRLINQHAGIYILFTDMCTVPYSTRIMAFLFSGYIADERYTQDKTDSLIALSPSSSKCGLQFFMHGHYGDHIHVKLKYSCNDNHGNITIINAVFHTHTGMICPLSRCNTSPPDNPLQQACKVPWIIGKDKQVEAHVEVLLHLCTPAYSIWWNIHVLEEHHHHPAEFPFEEKDQLKAGDLISLRLSKPKIMHDAVSNTNGYMYLGWGKVSLFTSGTSDVVYVSVLRHYPFDNDTIPLFRTEFWLKDVNKIKVCPPKDKSLATGLTIAGIGLLVFIVIVVILYRRRTRWRKTKGVGLPYQIHLAEEITQDIEMDDEALNEFN